MFYASWVKRAWTIQMWPGTIPFTVSLPPNPWATAAHTMHVGLTVSIFQCSVLRSLPPAAASLTRTSESRGRRYPDVFRPPSSFETNHFQSCWQGIANRRTASVFFSLRPPAAVEIPQARRRQVQLEAGQKDPGRRTVTGKQASLIFRQTVASERLRSG